jgi:hypothetical protein
MMKVSNTECGATGRGHVKKEDKGRRVDIWGVKRAVRSLLIVAYRIGTLR